MNKNFRNRSQTPSQERGSDSEKKAVRKSKVTNFANTKGDIVKVKIRENLKARSFLDSGAQVCLLMEKYAKLLEGSGLYQRVHWPLTTTLPDFSVVTYTEYMPQIPIVFDNQQVLLDLWISPKLSDEDLVLSKAAMFNLGFRLTTITGRDVWDENGEVKPEFVADNEDSEDEPPKTEEVEFEEEQLPLFPLFL
ncbi:MAG: hypothetical protein GY861_05225 [bacterium]|nr:hypothetical protein [bacterium]